MEELTQKEMEIIKEAEQKLFYYRMDISKDRALEFIRNISALRPDIKVELRIIEERKSENISQMALVTSVPLEELGKDYENLPFIKKVQRSELKSEFEINALEISPNFPTDMHRFVTTLNSVNEEKLNGEKFHFEIDPVSKIRRLISPIPYNEVIIPPGYYGNIGIDKDGYIGIVRYDIINVTIEAGKESTNYKRTFDVPYYKRMIEIEEKNRQLERIRSSIIVPTEELSDSAKDINSDDRDIGEAEPITEDNVNNNEPAMENTNTRRRRHRIFERRPGLHRVSAALTSAALFVGGVAVLLSSNDVTLSQLVVNGSVNIDLIVDLLKNINGASALLFSGSFVYDLIAVLHRVAENIQRNSIANEQRLERLEQLLEQNYSNLSEAQQENGRHI